jgi:hypothetical protein
VGIFKKSVFCASERLAFRYDEAMTTNEIHAHVETQSRDCDSTYDRTYVERPNDDERARAEGFEVTAPAFSEMDFMNRVFASLAGPYAVTLPMTVTVDGDGFEVNEQTEEGYRWAQVRWCYGECADERTFRDHAAEQAGY